MMAGTGRPSTAPALENWLAAKNRELEASHQRRDRTAVQSFADGTCEVDSRRLWNFASNDYLNLAHDRRVCAAFSAAAESQAGSGASALITGRSPWHAALEQELAAFEQTASAMLFPSGFAANLGVLSALFRRGDTVFCERLSHASLVDGCRLSGASLRVFRCDQLEKLESRLRRSPAGGRRFLVIDGVFSMDGVLAPLPELCEIAERQDVALIVDEAHGTGVLGAHGRGVCELQGVEQRIPVRIGTLSKALGAMGGFVTGSTELTDWLWNRARSQFYSTALPPAVCAAAVTSLQIVRSEPQRRRVLCGLARRLRSALQSHGLTCSGDVDVPIVPVLLGPADVATRVSGEVAQRGFLVSAIRPPTVPAGSSRLRISLSVAHPESVVDELAGAVAAAVAREEGRS